MLVIKFELLYHMGVINLKREAARHYFMLRVLLGLKS